MSRNMMILLILLMPVAIWLNLYAYYKYGRSLMKALPHKRRNHKIRK